MGLVKMNKLKQFLLSYVEDFLIFTGLFLIVFATFLINKIAGIYASGIVLFLMGIWFAKYPFKKGR